MHPRTVTLVSAAALLLVVGAAKAAPFESIRIGDRDGFGWTSTAGLVRASGVPHTTPADTNGNNLLQQGEFLPDINKNGSVATGSGDDWDNRSAAEVANTAHGCNGCTINGGTSGSNWTDLTLSTSAPNVNWPDAGPAVPNNAVFVFDFNVLGGDIVAGSTIFFNMVFGDYDVVPAQVNLDFASSSRVVNVSTQLGAEDGLIQAAFATLNFDEVFTADGSDWHGLVTATFLAPNEPYTAFDFVELSLQSIPSTVPEPGSLVLLGIGLAGLGWTGRRRRKT